MTQIEKDVMFVLALLAWSEARRARRLAAVSAAKVLADPLSWDALKDRVTDQALNSIINLALP